MSDFDKLITLIHSIETKDLLGDFLIGLTTDKEREELVKRVEIVEQLIKTVPQQKIANDLHVGIATVTRGSKELSAGRFKFLREK